MSVVPFLWYDMTAEQAAELYVSVFDDASIDEVRRWWAGSPYPEGTAMSVTVTIQGQRFELFNGGPDHPQTPAFSIFVSCKDQDEIDRYWDALTAGGGKPGPCGWLTDPYGVSWQIVPDNLGELLSTPEAGLALRGMSKIVIAELAGAGR